MNAVQGVHVHKQKGLCDAFIILHPATINNNYYILMVIIIIILGAEYNRIVHNVLFQRPISLNSSESCTVIISIHKLNDAIN